MRAHFLVLLAISPLVFAQVIIQKSSPVTLVVAAPDSVKTIMTCEPVLVDGKYTPKVKNCHFDNGGTLDDVVNAMTDMREDGVKTWKMVADHNLALAERGLALSKKANAHYLDCITKSTKKVTAK